MNIHFIGIGGIGLSALARYFLAKDHQVSGSDLEQSEITEALEQEGAQIFIGHDAEHVTSETDRVIYTAAINEDNPELKKAREEKIPTQSYAEALGELTKKHFTVAVTGTHGKSTTAAMTASILIEAGLDPTVILGTKFEQLEFENCRVGDSKFLVIEADEWDRSFLNYYPEVLTITNIEEEHLDCYQDLDDILNTYRELISHLPREGKLIVNKDHSNTRKLKHEYVKTFSLDQQEAEKMKEILKLPGEHNVSNALAALETARTLDISDEDSFKALANFKGVWRRFDIKDKTLKSGKEITVINDYGHHPTEIKAVLEATAEKYPEREKWAVFQPHQVARTANLFKDFVKTFKEITFGKIIITDIYRVAGREQKEDVSSKQLVEEVGRKNVIYVPQSELESFLLEKLENEVLVIMGAGDVYKLEEKISN